MKTNKKKQMVSVTLSLMMLLSILLLFATPAQAASKTSIYVITKITEETEDEDTNEIFASCLTFKYNKNGLLKSYKNEDGDSKTSFTYDKKGRIKTEKMGKYLRSYTYNKKGKISTINTTAREGRYKFPDYYYKYKYNKKIR